MTAALLLTAYGGFRPPPPPRNHIIRTRRRYVEMPNQVTGVQLIPRVDDPELYDVQIGPNGYLGLRVENLFARNSFDAKQLFDNIRLKRLIGNYGPLWSQEFRNALNANGVRCTGGDYYNVTFAVNVDGSYTVGFSTVIGAAPNETITVAADALLDPGFDLETVVRNIGAFLRIAGYTDLTTPAPNGVYAGLKAAEAVALWTFHY